MTTDVHKIAEQVKALSEKELEEFLDWLARYGLELTDAWDKEIERDAQPGGRLDAALGRVRKDIAEGKTRHSCREATLKRAIVKSEANNHPG